MINKITLCLLLTSLSVFACGTGKTHHNGNSGSPKPADHTRRTDKQTEKPADRCPAVDALKNSAAKIAAKLTGLKHTQEIAAAMAVASVKASPDCLDQLLKQDK